MKTLRRGTLESIQDNHPKHTWKKLEISYRSIKQSNVFVKIRTINRHAGIGIQHNKNADLPMTDTLSLIHLAASVPVKMSMGIIAKSVEMSSKHISILYAIRLNSVPNTINVEKVYFAPICMKKMPFTSNMDNFSVSI